MIMLRIEHRKSRVDTDMVLKVHSYSNIQEKREDHRVVVKTKRVENEKKKNRQCLTLRWNKLMALIHIKKLLTLTSMHHKRSYMIQYMINSYSK